MVGGENLGRDRADRRIIEADGRFPHRHAREKLGAATPIEAAIRAATGRLIEP
jgi:hypothetical protein